MAANTLGWVPAHLAYWQDSKVRVLPLAAQGALFQIFLLQFREGSVPSNLDDLSLVAGLRYSELAQVWPKISSFFVDVATDRMACPEWDSIRIEQETKNEAAVAKAKAAAEARWGKKQAKTPKMLQASKLDAPSIETGCSEQCSSNAIRLDKRFIYSELSQSEQTAERVLSAIATALDWAPPSRLDIEDHGSPDGEMIAIATELGEDAAVEIFLAARNAWTLPVTWKSLYPLRNQIWDDLRRSDGRLEPLPVETPTKRKRKTKAADFSQRPLISVEVGLPPDEVASVYRENADLQRIRRETLAKLGIVKEA